MEVPLYCISLYCISLFGANASTMLPQHQCDKPRLLHSLRSGLYVVSLFLHNFAKSLKIQTDL